MRMLIKSSGNSKYLQILSYKFHCWCGVCNHNMMFNTLKPQLNTCTLQKYIFIFFFLSEKCLISMQVSLNFVLESHIYNNSVLVPVMTCRWTGSKLLPEWMLTMISDAYVIIRPQWGIFHCSIKLMVMKIAKVYKTVWTVVETARHG